ncbi:MAG TPA: hypothetical protein VG817_12565 [Gemmatimonadales bacterium]|nr:hypothetical protein [Gemmatimonadales bacterium]
MPFLADPRLGFLPPERLARWVDHPVRRTFPALERSLIALARVSGAGRPLSEGERRILAEVFGESLSLEPVRVVGTRWLNAPTVLANTIRVRKGFDFSGWRSSVLVHEAMHLWQYQHHGTGYITDSVYHNLRSLMRTGRRALAYLNYQLHPESRLADFTAEQQATLVADWYELTHFFGNTPLAPAWVVARRGDLPIYQRLLDEIRAAPTPPGS